MYFSAVKKYDVILIGGGLAGLTACIHLAKHQLSVLVFERYPYPKHKVCGEYVSNEVKPYLQHLGVALDNLYLPEIDNFLITTTSNKYIKGKLPLGGFGISRYAFDHLLYQKATELGVEFIFEKVTSISSQQNLHIVHSKHRSVETKIVVGSFGKRSNIDLSLQRKFTTKPAPWVGIKAHYQHPDFSSNKVELHNFNGGYCGLSLTENKQVNFCYLAKYDVFKQFKNIADFNKNILCKNKYLAQFLEEADLTFEHHLAIAQVSFKNKKTIENNMLMIGDSAGLIHPLCGNGMAMAIHSAKIASEEIIAYQQHQSTTILFENYTQKWKATFQKRMKFGSIFQRILLKQSLTNIGIDLGSKMPFLVEKMIQQTHGKPIVCE